MVVLVTGATGFLGGVLIKKLLKDEKLTGKDIRVLALKDECCIDLEEQGIEIFRGDLQHLGSLKGLLKDITIVYHNAAIVISESVTREVMMKVNFHATIDLAKEFLKEETSKKFVFASSFGVYGMKYPVYPITEEYRKNPQNLLPLCERFDNQKSQKKIGENFKPIPQSVGRDKGKTNEFHIGKIR